jgi:hypothetical protein
MLLVMWLLCPVPTVGCVRTALDTLHKIWQLEVLTALGENTLETRWEDDVIHSKRVGNVHSIRLH